MYTDLIWKDGGVQCVYDKAASFEAIAATTTNVYEKLRGRRLRYLIQNFSRLKISIAGSASYLTIIAPGLAHDLGNGDMKTAIVCSDLQMLEMLELCLPPTEDNVRIFMTLIDAREWLGHFN